MGSDQPLVMMVDKAEMFSNALHISLLSHDFVMSSADTEPCECSGTAQDAI